MIAPYKNEDKQLMKYIFRGYLYETNAKNNSMGNLKI